MAQIFSGTFRGVVSKFPTDIAFWNPSGGLNRVSKQGVKSFAWRPEWQYNVAATPGADNVLASDCPAQFGCPSNEERVLHLCDSTVTTVAGPTAQRDKVLASKCEYTYISGGVKQGQFVILRFPLFCSVWGSKIPRCWEKQHEKCHCHTRIRVPQVLVKTRTWEQCPHMLAGKARENWQIDPVLPLYNAPLCPLSPFTLNLPELATFRVHSIRSAEVPR